MRQNQKQDQDQDQEEAGSGSDRTLVTFNHPQGELVFLKDRFGAALHIRISFIFGCNLKAA